MFNALSACSTRELEDQGTPNLMVGWVFCLFFRCWYLILAVKCMFGMERKLL